MFLVRGDMAGGELLDDVEAGAHPGGGFDLQSVGPVRVGLPPHGGEPQRVFEVVLVSRQCRRSGVRCHVHRVDQLGSGQLTAAAELIGQVARTVVWSADHGRGAGEIGRDLLEGLRCRSGAGPVAGCH